MNDMKMWSLILGLVASGLWLASAFVSFWAVTVKLDLTAPQGYRDHVGILMGTTADGTEAFSINGMNVPTQQKLEEYQRRVFRRNASAAVLNGTAAAMACCAAFMAFVLE